MAKWEGLNRRQFPRVNFPCLVVLNQAGSDHKETMLCHTENLGMGGICIILKQPVKIFSEVELELDLQDLKEHIKCRGKIVWNVQRKSNEANKPLYFDLGIEFIDLNPDYQNRIKAAIAKLVNKKP